MSESCLNWEMTSVQSWMNVREHEHANSLSDNSLCQPANAMVHKTSSYCRDLHVNNEWTRTVQQAGGRLRSRSKALGFELSPDVIAELDPAGSRPIY